MHPNVYVWLVGHPGTGKTRSIREARRYINTIETLNIAPTSVTFASLVDRLTKAKRDIKVGDIDLKYNSLMICADELGAFMHKYDNEMIDGLSAFYDPDPYEQTRRTNDIKIKIASPQINILCGCTPQNLTDFMPEKAWGQGFTSRLMLIFSDERILGNDFAQKDEVFNTDLAHDLAIINTLVGEFEATQAYQDAINNWRSLGEPPVPNHPKLIHYVTRRKAHLYKLSMIASIDRSNTLVLTVDDFNRAMGWLLEAEDTMIEIFKAGAISADAQAMDEILHFIRINDTAGHGVSEQRIIRFARDRVPIQSILRIIEILLASGQLELVGVDRTTKLHYYRISKPES